MVHIDIPENIMSTDYDPNPVMVSRTFQLSDTFDPLPVVPGQVEEAARMLAGAELPMIHAGSGVIHGQAFARTSGAGPTALCARSPPVGAPERRWTSVRSRWFP